MEDNPKLARTVSPPQQRPLQMSMELNMKSRVDPRPYSVSPDGGNRHHRDPDDSSDDEHGDGSQFFPGSGFF